MKKLKDGWESVRLGDIAITVTSGSRDWAQYYSDTGAKFIRMTNLNRNGITLLVDDLKFVNIQSNSADGKRTSLQANDILISITAELGKIGFIPENFGEAYINQHTALIRIDPNKAHSKFIAYVLSSATMNKTINSLNDAGAKAGLNLPTIKALSLKLPSIEEQTQIAETLSTWDNAIQTTEKLLKNSRQQKKALRQILLSGKNSLDWEEKALEELVVYQQPTAFLVKDTTYNDNFETAGKSFILGYTNENDGIYNNLPVIIFDDFTTDSQFVTFPFKIKSSAIKLLTAKKNVCIKYIFEAMQMIDFEIGGHQRHWISIFSKLKIRIPVFDEQQKITEILSTSDQEIETLQRKLECLKLEKGALMQRLLSNI